MANGTDLLNAARTFSGLTYSLDPMPDGVTTIDCSLLILKACEKAGIPLTGVRTAEQIRQATVPVAWDDVKPGDLLFFEHTYDAAGPAGPDGKIASHVGVSLGAGSHRMVDAHERAGPDVAETDISTSYWQDKLIEARRIPALAGAVDDGAAPPTTADPTTLPWGPDVASHQGAVDWRAVKTAGASFGWTKATGGAWYKNPTLAANWSGMKAAGLKRGAYHYAFELTGSPGGDPLAEADFFCAAMLPLGLTAGDMLALDAEEGATLDGQWALAWCERVRAVTGIVPEVYTGAWFSVPHGFGSVPRLADYPLWLAAYQTTMPTPPPPWKAVTFWQHTDAANIPGINGNADRSVFNGSAAQLATFGMGSGGMPDTTTYSVGPGILAEMQKHGDSPASSELYFKQGTHDEWSEAIGTSGARYLYVPSAGRVFRYDPAA